MTSVTTFLVALALAAVGSALLRRVMPATGGIAIFGAFLLALQAPFFTGAIPHRYVAMVAVAGAAFALGLLGDVLHLTLLEKRAGQLAIGFAAAAYGVRPDWLPPSISILVAALVIVACMNSLNLLERMDSLSAGTAAVAAFGLAVVAALAPPAGSPVVPAALSGACLGFLPFAYRRPGSRGLSMGGAGSQLVGFTLGALVLFASPDGAGGVAAVIAAPLVILAVASTGLVMLVRLGEWGPSWRMVVDLLLRRPMDPRLGERRALAIMLRARLLGDGYGSRTVVRPVPSGASGNGRWHPGGIRVTSTAPHLRGVGSPTAVERSAGRVLVTGGAGFIGSSLVERLLHEGYEVRVLDNFSTGHRRNIGALADEIELVEGDIRSFEQAHAAVQGCDVVVHQAALPSVPRSIQDPVTSNDANAIGTLNVLLAARDADVRRLVYASSSSVYGATERLPKSEDLAVAPISPYAVGKLAGEGYCRTFWTIYGLETVALRYFNVFGERQDPLSQYVAVIPSFVAALLSGQRPVVYGDGEQTRDFTYVGNAVDGTLLALRAEGVAGKVYNIAAGEQISVNRLLDELQVILATDVEPRYAPARPGEVRHSHADISLAAGELGYTPTFSLVEGLRLTTEYYEAFAAVHPR